MTDPVKLIIWDLDDTFWRGTLSEGEVQALDDNLALVRATAARGLIHTIVSKNDLAPVEAQLTELGVRDLFVFLRVSWQPKGPVIKQLLEDMQLRAPNALFLDDNSMNRAEALHYNPGLQVADPADLPRLAPALLALGKPDPTYARLEQYRLLERQQQARADYQGDNLAFLRDAGVRVALREGAEALRPDLPRIDELINRSNQLNYTKRRAALPELEASFREPHPRWGTVRVRDRFGDYGLVGVYCLNTLTNTLEQFTFSCRILHLGVEQWTYAHLGFPQLDVQGEVATELSQTEQPDWITLETEAEPEPNGVTALPPDAEKNRRLRILLKGGCDLGQLTPYLQTYQVDVTEDFNYVNDHQVPVHTEHTELLRLSRTLPFEEQRRLAEALPFLDREAFQPRLWQPGPGYDALVYSPLMDYTQDLYREKSTGILVPFGGYQDLTRVDPVEQARRYAQRKFWGMDEAWLRRFQQDFSYAGPLTPARFQENLAWLRQQLLASVPLILLTGAEVDVPESPEPGAVQRHQQMNAALLDFAARTPNVLVVDVRDIVRTRADVTNNLRHYQRPLYKALADKLAAELARWQGRQLSRSTAGQLRAALLDALPRPVRKVWDRFLG
jgi:FkbH-like protein